MPAWLSNAKPSGAPATPGKDPQAGARLSRGSSFKRVDCAKPADTRSLVRKDSTMRSGRCDDTPICLKRSLVFAVPLDFTAQCYSNVDVALMSLELCVFHNAELCQCLSDDCPVAFYMHLGKQCFAYHCCVQLHGFWALSYSMLPGRHTYLVNL